MPKVYNKHEWYPLSAVYCGRGSRYGNPFVVGHDGTRDEVCDKFDEHVLPHLDVLGAARQGPAVLLQAQAMPL